MRGQLLEINSQNELEEDYLGKFNADEDKSIINLPHHIWEFINGSLRAWLNFTPSK